jgi:hypothetical protein
MTMYPSKADWSRVGGCFPRTTKFPPCEAQSPSEELGPNGRFDSGDGDQLKRTESP